MSSLNIVLWISIMINVVTWFSTEHVYETKISSPALFAFLNYFCCLTISFTSNVSLWVPKLYFYMQCQPVIFNRIVDHLIALLVLSDAWHREHCKYVNAILSLSFVFFLIGNNGCRNREIQLKLKYIRSFYLRP